MKYIKSFLVFPMLILFFLYFNEDDSLALMSGTGTQSDPYIIMTAEQLDGVRNNLSASYQLGADIDLAPYLSEGGAGFVKWGASGWKSIGELTENPNYWLFECMMDPDCTQYIENPFTGKFDGNGYTISNLTINRSNNDYIGLFGFARAAEFTNVRLVDVDVIGKFHTGGLLGGIKVTDTAATINISNSYVTGRVHGVYDVGGLIGTHRGTISKSYASVNVTGSSSGTSNAGGLVGRSFGAIHNSFATGNVVGHGDIVGGLVGQSQFVSATVQNSYATGTVTGRSAVGGLVGHNNNASVYNSFATGTVTATGSNVGGLVGTNLGTSATINSSYYDMNTTGQTDTGKGIGKTTAEMKQKATYSGWDFTNTWWIRTDYPKLVSVNPIVRSSIDLGANIYNGIDNKLYGSTEISTQHANYTGEGFLGSNNVTNSGFAIKAPNAFSSITFRYAANSTNAGTYYVNSKSTLEETLTRSGNSYIFEKTGGWDIYQEKTLNIADSKGKFIHVAYNNESTSGGFNPDYMLFNNNPPTDISLSSNEVYENVSNGTVVGTLGATDPEENLEETFTFNLTSGTGGVDNRLFTIVGTELRTNGAIVHEGDGKLNIRIKVTDSVGNIYEKPFKISVNVTAVTDLTELTSKLALANQKLTDHPEGSNVGEASESARTALQAAITTAQEVVDNAGTKTEAELDVAAAELQSAIEVFNEAVVKAGSTTDLSTNLAVANQKLLDHPEGSNVGEASESARTALQTAITTAQEIADNAGTKTEVELDVAAAELQRAIESFNEAVVKVGNATDLTTNLAVANQKLLDHPEGSNVGEASESARTALQVAITTAQEVADNAGTKTEAELDVAAADLQSAIEAFNEAVVKVTVPSPPTNITVIVGNGEATVSFTAPENNGGDVIIGYKVIADPGQITATGTTSSIKITGLTNGTVYTFTVIAINSAGSSTASSHSPKVTPYVPSSGGGGGSTLTPTQPTQEMITVPVETGNLGSGTTVTQTPITRTIDQSGKVKDEVTLTTERAKETTQSISQSGQNTARIVIPDTKDEVGQVNINVQKEATKELGDKNINLEIFTNNVRIIIPQGSMDNFEQDLYFRVTPIKEESQRKEVENRARVEQIVREVAKDDNIAIVSRPMTIETNMQSRPVTLVLPLRDVQLPTNAAERAKFLRELVIFIEHSDGEKRLVKGKIVDYKEGQLGLEFEVNKFSTFTILHLEGFDGNFHEAYIKGFEDGTFKPNNTVTRAEIAAMIARNLGYDDAQKVANTTFSDVQATHWAAGVIGFAKQQGLMKGDNAGKFNPNAAITRAEMAAIVARYKELMLVTEAESAKVFPDIAGHWAVKEIAANKQAGIISGYQDGSFSPNGNLTRAEAVKVINRMFERGPLYGVISPSFKDVPTTHWAFHEVEEAAQAHFFTLRQEGGEDIINNSN